MRRPVIHYGALCIKHSMPMPFAARLTNTSIVNMKTSVHTLTQVKLVPKKIGYARTYGKLTLKSMPLV